MPPLQEQELKEISKSIGQQLQFSLGSKGHCLVPVQQVLNLESFSTDDADVWFSQVHCSREQGSAGAPKGNGFHW